ncbi:HAD-like domain-containing protein [Entophlyctis helioformis]|nr:HAD-like domain-containing protein [Entophlyctis helioformis]
MVRLVAFDCYNTLFRVRLSPGVLYARELQRWGLVVQEARAAAAFRSVYKRLAAAHPNFGAGHMTAKSWWHHVVQDTLIEAGVPADALSPVFDKVFANLYFGFTQADSFVKYPEVDSVLSFVRSRPNVKLGVITNSDARTNAVLESLSIRSFFDFVICSHDHGHMKPHPSIFSKALELAGLTDPSQALYVGDDITNDYFGATAQGWQALLLVRDETTLPPAFEPHASDVIHSLDELRNLFP